MIGAEKSQATSTTGPGTATGHGAVAGQGMTATSDGEPATPADPATPAGKVAIAALAKALGHPARIGIVAMLYAREGCIGCDIVDEIGLAQSTISEHLRILKAAGVIVGEIERPRICYSLNPAALAPLGRFLEGLAAAPSSRR